MTRWNTSGHSWNAFRTLLWRTGTLLEHFRGVRNTSRLVRSPTHHLFGMFHQLAKFSLLVDFSPSFHQLVFLQSHHLFTIFFTIFSCWQAHWLLANLPIFGSSPSFRNLFTTFFTLFTNLHFCGRFAIFSPACNMFTVSLLSCHQLSKFHKLAIFSETSFHLGKISSTHRLVTTVVLCCGISPFTLLSVLFSPTCQIITTSSLFPNFQTFYRRLLTIFSQTASNLLTHNLLAAFKLFTNLSPAYFKIVTNFSPAFTTNSQRFAVTAGAGKLETSTPATQLHPRSSKFESETPALHQRSCAMRVHRAR